jgi:hypothetical protein
VYHAVVLLAVLSGPVQQAILGAVGVRGFDDRIDVNATWTNVAEAVDRVGECRARVDAAVAAGTGLDVELDLREAPDVRDLPLKRKDVSTLRLLRGFCDEKEKKVTLLRASLAIREAQRELKDLARGKIEPERLRSKLASAAMKQRVCARDAAKALAGNGPVAMERPDMSLADAEAKVCKPLAEKIAAAKADLPQGDLKLTGDRDRVWKEQSLVGESVYGGGKMPLATGNDLAHAKVWHVEYRDQDDRGETAWRVVTYRFEGDKLVETKEKTGSGREAPDDAF